VALKLDKWTPLMCRSCSDKKAQQFGRSAFCKSKRVMSFGVDNFQRAI
jgi:hypothetical protein